MVHFTRSLFLFFGTIYAVSGRPEPQPRGYKSDVCQSGQYSKYSPLAHYGPAKDYCSKTFPTVKHRVNYRRAADAEPAYRATTTSCAPAKPTQCSGKPEKCLLSSIKNGPKHVAKTACSCITKTTPAPGYPKTTVQLDKHLANKGLYDHVRFFHEHLHYSIFVVHDYVHIDFCVLHEQFRDYIVLLHHEHFHDKHFRSNALLHDHFRIDFHLLFEHINGFCFDNKHDHNLCFLDDFLRNYIYHDNRSGSSLNVHKRQPSTDGILRLQLRSHLQRDRRRKPASLWNIQLSSRVLARP
ncbi:hypothetical protein CB0940_01028 [Cercospora beticola]|uniref:Uncharacterized protein n=1 Tax=Cercospora beticola TaxID=122368 RepID=A0A2G5I8I0_CERBT|nr:hypothetical protein CB0940_01028 [Cercospora beticola]PIB00804.1 hypothetical protein CB0940_01028 [Cercospora beticola]